MVCRCRLRCPGRRISFFLGEHLPHGRDYLRGIIRRGAGTMLPVINGSRINRWLPDRGAHSAATRYLGARAIALRCSNGERGNKRLASTGMDSRTSRVDHTSTLRSTRFAGKTYVGPKLRASGVGEWKGSNRRFPFLPRALEVLHIRCRAFSCAEGNIVSCLVLHCCSASRLFPNCYDR